MILPVVVHPNQILREKTHEIPAEDIQRPAFQNLIRNMVHTMRNARGIGLAAPQVNERHRLTVIQLQEGEQPLVLINPYIVGASFRKETGEEGCLSIPGVYGTVKRNSAVTVEYRDETGARKTLKAKHLLARVIQHEIDHLEGVLFIDKAETITASEQITPSYPYL